MVCWEVLDADCDEETRQAGDLGSLTSLYEVVKLAYLQPDDKVVKCLDCLSSPLLTFHSLLFPFFLILMSLFPTILSLHLLSHFFSHCLALHCLWFFNFIFCPIPFILSLFCSFLLCSLPLPFLPFSYLLTLFSFLLPLLSLLLFPLFSFPSFSFLP